MEFESFGPNESAKRVCVGVRRAVVHLFSFVGELGVCEQAPSLDGKFSVLSGGSIYPILTPQEH